MSGNSVRIIVGLGNPGSQYERTWHNLGFLALDALRQAEDYDYGEWTLDAKPNVLVASGTLPGVRVMLAKPQAMMNNSGPAIAALMRGNHLRPSDLWLVHDEIDLPWGKLRISRNASAAGHRGVQSVFDALGTSQITRFRIGIATPERGAQPAEEYVLQPLPEAAAAALPGVLERVVAALTLAQLAGVPEAMNQYN